MVPLGRLELPHLAPEASALSTELQGQIGSLYLEISIAATITDFNSNPE